MALMVYTITAQVLTTADPLLNHDVFDFQSTCEHIRPEISGPGRICGGEVPHYILGKPDDD